MRGARLTLTLATAALCAAVVVVAGASAGGPAPGALVLPDLVQRPPYDVSVEQARDGSVRLGFGSAVVNAGAGPLIIEGRRPSQRRAVMPAEQLVRREGAPLLRRPGAGSLRYTRERSHDHWHLLRFDRYTLRRAGGTRAVVADRKSGFCLGDRFEASPSQIQASVADEPPFMERCGLSRPQLLRVVEGISVGYGDDYGAYLEGQYLDITGLPAGRYELVHRVNGDRELLEQRYDNNAACLRVTLSRRDGQTRVRTRGRCDP